MLKNVFAVILIFGSLAVAATAAVDCSVVVGAETPFEEGFSEAEAKWVEAALAKAREYAGDQFHVPAMSSSKQADILPVFLPLERELAISQQVLTDLEEAPLQHEIWRSFFRNKLVQDSVGFRIESAFSRVQNRFQHSQKPFIGLLVAVAAPYESLFADFGAVVSTHNEQAIVKHLRSIFNSRGFRILDPYFSPWQFDARGFNYRFDIYSFEEQIPPAHSLEGFEKYDRDLVLVGARPIIWKKYVGDANIDVEKARQVANLLYRASRKEIFARLRNPWLWNAMPQLIRERFVARLSEEASTSADLNLLTPQ